MMKLRGLFFVALMILAINRLLVHAHSLKPVNQAGKDDVKVGKTGFFEIFDNLLDKGGEEGEDLNKDKEILICKNCTIIIASASNGSSAGNRLSIGNGPASTGSNRPGSNGVASNEAPSNGAGSNGTGTPFIAVGVNGALSNGVGGLSIGADVIGNGGTAAPAPANVPVPVTNVAATPADGGIGGNTAPVAGGR